MIDIFELEHRIPLSDFPLKEKNLLDSGADSFVYRCTEGDKDFVVKVYKPEITLEQILLYQKVTNQVAGLLQNQRIIYKVNIGRYVYEYTVSVIPMELAGVNPEDPTQIITVSQFIPGPRLYDRLPNGVPFKAREFANPVSIELEELSDQLNEKFNIKGILIVEPNVKFQYNPDQNPQIHLTVTDLCSHLWSFGAAPK